MSSPVTKQSVDVRLEASVWLKGKRKTNRRKTQSVPE